MKKFLKILLIIIGIVFLIFAALICIGLFVDYDDHIENGRYTYVPEDDNKDNAYVEFNLSDYDKKNFLFQKIFLIMLMKYCIYGMANSMIRFSIGQEAIMIPFKVL